MSTFTETLDGQWINLDHATEIRHRAKGGWFAKMVDGDTHQLCFSFDPETLARHSVPAEADLFALEVFFHDGDDEATGPPSIERSPIVAWRVDGGRGATPIAFDFEAPLKAVEYPNGMIYMESGLAFSGLNEYIDHRRKEWRAEIKEHAARIAAESARVKSKEATS